MKDLLDNDQAHLLILHSEQPNEEPEKEEKPADDAKTKKEEGRGRRPTKHGSLERKPGLPGRQRTRSESLTRKNTGVRQLHFCFSTIC